MRSLLQKPCAYLPQRYVMTLMTVTGLIFFYLMRVSSILAISEMTITANTTKSNATKSNTTSNSYCPKGTEDQNSNTKAEFAWDQSTKSNIIMAFYIGYIVAHIPSGVISDAMGGKAIFGYGMLLCASITLSIPTLARISPYAFMVGRIIQGFGQGVMIPPISSLIAKWAPTNEISRMNGIILSGVHMGYALGFIISGLILDTFSGWAAVFYISGGAAILWCLLWYILVFSSPEKHPFITEEERDMILRLQKIKKKPKHIPWVSIITSIPFLTVLLSNFAHSWAISTLINELPMYSKKVLNFNMRQSGLSSAAPHIPSIFTAISSGYLVDWIINKGYLSVTNARKIFSVAANVLPVPFLIGVSYAGCDRILVVNLLMIMMLFKGLSYASIKALPVDMAPNYAGILMAFVNLTGVIAGFASPFFTAVFITGDGSVEEWRNVFFLGGFVMIIFPLPFLCFGTAEIQSWNHETEPEEEEKPEEEIALNENKKL